MKGVSERFWEQVAERAAPTEYTVGQIVLVENEKAGTQEYKVIAETWIAGDGSYMARTRDATEADLEAAVPPHLVIVVPDNG